MRIIRASSKDRLIEFAALRLTRIINATLEHNDRFSLVLAGGSTPRPVYERLADPAYADDVKQCAEWIVAAGCCGCAGRFGHG